VKFFLEMLNRLSISAPSISSLINNLLFFGALSINLFNEIESCELVPQSFLDSNDRLRWSIGGWVMLLSICKPVTPFSANSTSNLLLSAIPAEMR
jgi:hypothetical protein